MSYLLYYAPGAASMAVHWMLIELDVEFRTQQLDLTAGDQRLPTYLRINPAGRVPTLVIDNEVYTESAALLMLLAERHPAAGLAPAIGDPRRPRWLETMVYLANTLSSAMRDWFYADKDGDPAGADAVRRLAQKRIESVWDRLDGVLADGRLHLPGEAMTTADLLATMLMRWSRNMPRPATTWESYRALCDAHAGAARFSRALPPRRIDGVAQFLRRHWAASSPRATMLGSLCRRTPMGEAGR